MKNHEDLEGHSVMECCSMDVFQNPKLGVC